MKQRNSLPRTRISPMQGLWFIALVVMMIFTSSNAYSGFPTGVIDLPRTGQTLSYDANVPPRDDGALQTGVDWTGPKFQDNGDGTITDLLTGLTWLQDANCLLTSGNDTFGYCSISTSTVCSAVADCPNGACSVTGARCFDSPDSCTIGACTVSGKRCNVDSNCWGPRVCIPDGNTCTVDNAETCIILDGGLSWNDASSFVTDINNNNVPNISNCGYTGGTYTDWRMPNINEFDSLLNFGAADMAQWLTDQGFQNVQKDNYWVNTSYSFYAANGWAVRITENASHIIYETLGQWDGNRTKPGLYNCPRTRSWGTLDYHNCSFPLIWPVREGPNNTPDPTYPANLRKTGQGGSWGISWPNLRFETPDSDMSGVCEIQRGTACTGPVKITGDCSQKYCTDQRPPTSATPCINNGDCPTGSCVTVQSCILNGDVVNDNLTGLMWTQSGNIAVNEMNSDGIIDTWQGALDFMDDMNTGARGRCIKTPSPQDCQRYFPSSSGSALPTEPCTDPLLPTCRVVDFVEQCRSAVLTKCTSSADCDTAGGETCVFIPNYGYTDWRLPNIVELQSLGNFAHECQGGGSDGDCPRAGPRGSARYLEYEGFYWITGGTSGYWSSTTDGFDTGNAYNINLGRQGGVIGYYGKNSTRPPDWGPSPAGRALWPVRAGVPDISSVPASYDFGDVNVGATSTAQTFTISNDGNKDLDIEQLSITGPDASDFNIVALSDNCSNTTVTPTNSCTVDVECIPLSFGAKSADLSIPSNDPDEDPLLVGLDCRGMAPDISASPGSFNCGAMNLGNTTAVPITVSNDGNADLIIGAISVTGDTGEFSVDASACSNQTVGVGNSCPINAECAPVSEGGPWCIDISIPSNDPDENPLIINICETGVLDAAPDLIVSDLSIPKVKKNRRGHIAKIFVDYKVMNQGTGDSVPSKLGVYLSRDTVLDAGDTYIGSANIPSLAPGEETPRLLRAKRFKLRPPVSSSGTWYVLGKADDNDDNTELDENNNVTPTLATGSGR